MDKLKAIFIDLDNTLWNGILAEKQNLILNADLYTFLKHCYEKGVLLFVVSKNDLADVRIAFEKLGIDENLFVHLAVNWDPKYLNVEKLIQVTSLRPETVALIDDNPFEREEVQKRIPTITTFSESEYKNLDTFLDQMIDESEIEITNRINRFKTSLQADIKRHTYKEGIDFLRSLNRRISIGTISPDQLERFTKLLVSTHRINFNPGTFPDYDRALEYLHQRMNEEYELYAVSAEEGGVSLGLVGALVVHLEKDIATLTDGTFTCSILGRDIEHKALIGLIEILKQKNIKEFKMIVTLTETNTRIRDLLNSLGFIQEEITTKTEHGDIKAIYCLRLEEFNPKETFDWIHITGEDPKTDFAGIPSVIEFFKAQVKPLIANNFVIANLGSAKGEVFGFVEPHRKEEWERFIAEKQIIENKIDLEYYPEEKNIVGNAEDLRGVIDNNSQDLVMAIELLEHTEHFWKCINEIIRITKIGGYIFITVPSFGYPKHEYPIDLWRIGPETLQAFFPVEAFSVLNLVTEGQEDKPRRSMILVKKVKDITTEYTIPNTGKVNWENGLTVFP